MKVRLFMAGFINDNAGQVNLFGKDKPPTLETLLMMMQHHAQILLESGGNLELAKCLYHFIYYDFLKAEAYSQRRKSWSGFESSQWEWTQGDYQFQIQLRFPQNNLSCFVEPPVYLKGMKILLTTKRTNFTECSCPVQSTIERPGHFTLPSISPALGIHSHYATLPRMIWMLSIKK
jgi:hypothetical protein